MGPARWSDSPGRSTQNAPANGRGSRLRTPRQSLRGTAQSPAPASRKWRRGHDRLVRFRAGHPRVLVRNAPPPRSGYGRGAGCHPGRGVGHRKGRPAVTSRAHRSLTRPPMASPRSLRPDVRRRGSDPPGVPDRGRVRVPSFRPTPGAALDRGEWGGSEAQRFQCGDSRAVIASYGQAAEPQAPWSWRSPAALSRRI